MTVYEIKPDGSLIEIGDLPLTDIEPSLSRGQCPDCLATDWRQGPRGGASGNIECRNCKARFNVAVWLGQVVMAQRIESEADGGSHWREDMFPA